MSSKRDQFENQLKDLQNDISNLSQKLNLSSIRTTNSSSKVTSKGLYIITK